MNMFIPSFHLALAQARHNRKLSLRKLSAQTGLSRTRLTRLENGERCPKAEERAKLASFFPEVARDLHGGCSRPEVFYKTLRLRCLRLRPAEAAFYPPADRLSRIRMGACKDAFRREFDALTLIIHRRNDLKELSTFCDCLSLGSGWECLFVLHLCALGAVPGFSEPGFLTPRLPHPVICPKERIEVWNRPMPCFVLDDSQWFVQVSFATPKLYTVDFLCHSAKGWKVVEIDGPWHNPSKDQERARAIGLPEERLNQKRLLELVWRTIARDSAA